MKNFFSLISILKISLFINLTMAFDSVYIQRVFQRSWEWHNCEWISVRFLIDLSMYYMYVKAYNMLLNVFFSLEFKSMFANLNL